MINHIKGEYGDHLKTYYFCSHHDEHLRVKVHRLGCATFEKVSFSPERLKQIGFNQTALRDKERLPILVKKLFPDEHDQTSSEEWHREVSERSFPSLYSYPLYEKMVEACKSAMSLDQVEEGLSDYEKEYLDKIDRAVTTLSCVKESDSNQQESALYTLIESSYHLIMMPIREIVSFMGSSHYLYMPHQMEFREKLQQCIPESEREGCRKIIGEIGSCLSEGVEGLKATSQALKEQFPHLLFQIENLAQLGESLLRKAKEEAQREITHYTDRSEVAFCLELIFNCRLDLLQDYSSMLEGRYSSLKHIPRGFSSGKIYFPSYLTDIYQLLNGYCEQKIKEACDRYRRSLCKHERFENTIIPLIRALVCVDNLLKWPGKPPLSEAEEKYLGNHLYFLAMMISKHDIHPKYWTLSDEEQKQARRALKGKEQEEPFRLLFHANIPWRALFMVGSLFHGSGGVSKENLEQNKRLALDAFPDLFKELPKIKIGIEELLDFERNVFNPEVTFGAPETAEYHSFSFLASLVESKKSLKKLNEILNFWNQGMTSEDWKSPERKLAVLRTIQILGELCKNLGRWELLSEDPTWKTLECLRDLLSHTERPSVSKRLSLFIKGEDSGSLCSKIQADFLVLRDYFFSFAFTIEKVEWGKHMNRRKTFYKLNGLNELWLFLDGKIPPQKQELLKETARSEEAIKGREEVATIKKKFLEKQYESKDVEVKKLPLSNSKKKKLQELIKAQQNKKVAEEKQQEKYEELCELLDEVVVVDSLQVEEFCMALIVDLQGDRLPRGELEIRLTALGVTSPRALTEWEGVQRSCSQKKKTHASERSKEEFLALHHKRALSFIDDILDWLNKLDALFPKGGNRFGLFKDHLFIQLACQYLVSDFRQKASLLEENLQALKFSYFDCGQLFEDVQGALVHSIAKGNEVLHVHDVTELSTRTEYGQVLAMYQHIAGFLINYSMGESREVLMSSFRLNLQRLREVMNSKLHV